MSVHTEPESTRIDNRYGKRRYGDPAEQRIRPRRQLEDVREQRHPDEITDREAFGAGLKLDDNFDFVIENGTLQTMAGIPILGRDLAFRISGVGMRILGDSISARLLSQLEFRIAEIITDDNRVEQLYRCTARQSQTDTVEVVAGVVADDGEYHEFIFPVDGKPTVEQPPTTGGSVAGTRSGGGV